MDIAERYIRLAHAIDVHSEGFVDGYGGPPEWADRTRREPAELQVQAGALLSDVQNVADAARREFLRVQVSAMHTMTRLIGGEAIPYGQEVRGLYDIDPVLTDLNGLDAALDALEAAVPGSGPLSERIEKLRQKVIVPREDLLRLAQPILAELRRRTQTRFGLPEGEDFSISLVSDKPWGGYNWPLGNLKSRIDLNTDLPVPLTGLPDLLAHEGYPGHHTEHATKEARLVREKGWLEHGIQLMNAPECAVSEGIATNALDAVMGRNEVRDWLGGELAALAGLNGADVLGFLDVTVAQKGLKGTSGTAALMLHGEGRPEAEVLEFLRRYALATPERARQTLRFIGQPQFRAYIFTYSVGSDLVQGWMKKHGPEGFGRLLHEPLTPGQLAAD
ncbi:hypothetical protein GCM10010840_23090 [Deinococcus aerolatus]|uniref:DUF885 domain-containing protein n=1 Tax=Deinococcus aerolatus TaxID=522487 RepID=A0ABQ2GB94_9DEIO|nr:hypothetical protein [Deinococcus aerolatus]GGL84616.1 hypothetical protein GCM10010840_23090 [Deinococcus aerolatus]